MNQIDHSLDFSILDNLLFLQIKTIIDKNRNHVQNNFENVSTFNGLQSIEFQKFITTQYQLISKQTQALDLIKQEINRKKSHSNHQIIFCGPNTNNLDILPMESSFDMSNISSVQGYDQQMIKTKFGQQFQKTLITSALNQVQQNCSLQTYEAIKNCVMNNKQKQYESAIQKIDKLTKRNEQLQTLFIIKSSQMNQIQSQLKQSLQKLQLIEDEKKKLKVKSNQLSQKQKRICKMQNSIIFKQKLFHQGKKRYQRQKNLFLNIENRLNNLYKDMHVLWENIIFQMQKSDQIPCSNNCQNLSQNGGVCWKKQVMRKCKQQLIDQRNLLKQQEDQIQKQYQNIHLLSDQVRKLASQKQLNTSSIDPFLSDNGSILIDSFTKS